MYLLLALCNHLTLMTSSHQCWEVLSTDGTIYHHCLIIKWKERREDTLSVIYESIGAENFAIRHSEDQRLFNDDISDIIAFEWHTHQAVWLRQPQHITLRQLLFSSMKDKSRLLSQPERQLQICIATDYDRHISTNW